MDSIQKKICNECLFPRPEHDGNICYRREGADTFGYRVDVSVMGACPNFRSKVVRDDNKVHKRY